MASSEEKKFKKLFLAGMIVACVFSAFGETVRSENSITILSEQSQLDSKTKEKIKELEKKANLYRDIIEIKRKQQNSLNNQLSIIDTEMDKLESELSLKKEEISDINDEIERLKNQIEKQEESIDYQKKIITNLLQVYYENKRQDIVLSLFNQQGIYFLISSEDKLTQTSEKVNEILKNVKSLKENMEREKITLEDKREKLTQLYSDVEEKSVELENSKEHKKILISQTKGDEFKYKELLTKVEAQKEELLSVDDLSIGAGLSADNYAKPPSEYHASTSWYYSQKDSRWGNSTIGNSNSTMKNWGCAITSVAMVFTYKGGGKISPQYLAKQAIYFWDLISWPKSWPSLGVIMDTSYGSSHGNINWKSIDAEIKNGNPVIVYLKKTKGKGGHYVVVHHKTSDGKYVVHDPYFGPNLYLDTSKSLVGLMGTDSGVYIDQMIVYKKTK